ncbi:MAG TPA: hypothetical protein VHR45_00730 [Thermoanaerobaculia bacterium]|nr:hypothetical protein [Thermoanaerobaculia bacterium]
MPSRKSGSPYSFLTALIMTIGVGAFQAPAASAQTCSPPNPPLIHAGDQVTVETRLTTGDPNENGEGGESLSIRSTGGFTVLVSTYNTRQSFTFKATIDGETITGTINGGDGDESCTLKVTVNAKQRLSDDQKKAANRTAVISAKISAGLWGVEKACSFVQNFYFKVCTAISGIGAPLAALTSAYFVGLGLDPSDPNFMVIATPVVPSLPPLTVQTGVTLEVANAFNALVQNDENILGYSSVILTCLNRAQGAADAGNAFWEAKQEAAAAQYESQLGTFLKTETSLLASLQSALQAENFPTIVVTPNDVLNFEKSVAASGLPSDGVSTLQQLGASPDQIAQITQVTIVQDVNAAAHTFPTSLTDPDLLAVLRDAGQAFQASSSCVSSSTNLCLNNGRFAVGATFSSSAQSGTAQVVQLTPDTGYLWFFSSSNAEVVVKVINGCALGGNFWVFAGGLTNLNTVITVTDTKTGAFKTYTNPQNTAFRPIQDTSAFAACNTANSPSSANSADGAADAAEPMAPPALRIVPADAATSEAQGTVAVGTMYATGTGLNGSSLIFSISNYATNPTGNPIATFNGKLLDVGIDPTTQVLYILDDASVLYRIDLAALTATTIGTGPAGLNSLVFSASGQAYEWGSDRFLYAVDKNTGVFTRIGSTGFAAAGDLAFDLDGTLYGSSADGNLIRIDPATGAGSAIGAMGFNDFFGLAIDASGTLYGARGSESVKISKIYTIDKNTGSSSLVGSIANDPDSVSGLALSTGTPPAPALLLNNNRFRVDVQWTTSNDSGPGTPVKLTSDTGYFWFFNASNIELLIKVLDGCGLDGHYWVFAGGLTNVATQIRVTDTRTGAVKTYSTVGGPPFQPIQDTSAFATCP